MDQQPEHCAKCGTLPDDILTLTCNHDLCLPCAAKNLQKEISKYGETTKSIMCDLCGAPTILDETSVDELLKIPIPPQIRDRTSWNYSPTGHISGYHSPHDNGRGNRSPIRHHSPIQRSPVSRNRDLSKFPYAENIINERSSDRMPMRSFCIEHPDEEISYFCFDCLTNCVCPECVIHGSHRNHDVLTVKKSYNVVKNKVEEALQGLSGKIDESRIVEDRFNSTKRDMRDHSKVLKKQVSDIFQEIRARIDKKEKEILNTMDTALEETLKESDQFSRILEEKVSKIHSSYDLVKNHLSAKDEVLLLNFYSSNHAKLRQQLESEELDLNRLYDSYIPKMPYSFGEVIDSLNILQAQISAIGNVGPEKFRNYSAVPELPRGHFRHNSGDHVDKDISSDRYPRRDRDVRREYPLGSASASYARNPGQRSPNTSGVNKGYGEEDYERTAKPTNFRNFSHNTSKIYSEPRSAPYGNIGKYK